MYHGDYNGGDRTHVPNLHIIMRRRLLGQMVAHDDGCDGSSTCSIHLFRTKIAKTLKHLPQIILITALIEAWHGAFTMHYQLNHGLAPHLILDLARVYGY
jgi:hypothetical protein